MNQKYVHLRFILGIDFEGFDDRVKSRTRIFIDDFEFILGTHQNTYQSNHVILVNVLCILI